MKWREQLYVFSQDCDRAVDGPLLEPPRCVYSFSEARDPLLVEQRVDGTTVGDLRYQEQDGVGADVDDSNVQVRCGTRAYC